METQEYQPFAPPLPPAPIVKPKRFHARNRGRIGLVALVAVLAAVGTLYVRERADLARTHRRLNAARTQLDDTRRELTSAQGQLSSARSTLGECRAAIDEWQAAWSGMAGVALEALGQQAAIFDLDVYSYARSSGSMEVLVAASGAAAERAKADSAGCAPGSI